MKERNPSWGCLHIAAQISLAFGITLDKDVVRRVLARHYRPMPGGIGPSWLTFLGQMKDSLWSIDLFRCESARLKSHWVLLVMDQCIIYKSTPARKIKPQRIFFVRLETGAN
jgi:hypothetical protein